MGLERLQAILREMDSVLVTFSGGVDSALLARVAHDVLGERAVAMTAVSPTLPVEEAEEAQAVARANGVQHIIVQTHELDNPEYVKNDGRRCYFCKTELFSVAERERKRLGLNWVADGTIVDDLGTDRPGLRAAAEGRVRHPLVEAGFSKPEVRSVAKALGLSVWQKPAFACLGSRFPVGTPVTRVNLGRIARVESELRTLGFLQFRVRIHVIKAHTLARVELGVDEITRFAQPQVRQRIEHIAREVGFRWVTLDLAGYQPPKSELASAK